MHSLWSRAAQAQSSCRCRTCLHPNRSILRRSTTAASRRKASAADVFTACYTTILGTAAVLDAQRKDARRKELDTKLEKARAALDNLTIQQSSTQQDEETDYTDPGPSKPLENRGPTSKRWIPDNVYATKIDLQEMGALSKITQRPFPCPSWMQTQLEWVNVEAAMLAEERDPDFILREPKSMEQLERTKAATIELVNKLIWRTQTCESSRSQDVKMREDPIRTEDTWKDLKDILQTSHYPSYQHPQIDPADTAIARSVLGESIRRIFNQAASSGEIVAKICYNILVSSAPPTIHTYNTLIAGFNRIQRPDLAQTVINSYINKTAWPATQQTIVCLLNHYRGSNHRKGVSDIVKRMRGVRERGLHFCIIDKEAIYSEEWLTWAKENCASRRHAYVQRAQRDDDIFNSVIKAWMHCGEIGNACMAFVACLRKEALVPIQTVLELLMATLATFDSAGARALQKGFAKHLSVFTALIDRVIREESVAISRQLLACVSHLMYVCWFPFEEIFKCTIEEHDEEIQEFRFFINKTRLELEIQEAADLCRSTLEEINSDDPLINRLERAIENLDSAQRSRQKVEDDFTNYLGLMKTLSIYRRYRDLESRIELLKAQAKASILAAKTGYTGFDNITLLTLESHMTQHRRARQDRLLNALRVIQIYRGPMTEQDVKLQLLRRLPYPSLARKFENSGNVENLTIRSLTSFFYKRDLITTDNSDGLRYNESIRQLERELIDIEETIKATLFAHLGGHNQSKMRFRYPNWDKMPLESFFAYYMPRGPRRPSVAAVEQTDVKSFYQENPAIRMPEEPSTEWEDGYEISDIVRPTRRRRPIRPSMFHGEGAPFSLATLG